MNLEMKHRWVGGHPCETGICVSGSTFELEVRLLPLNMFKPSSYFTDCYTEVLLLWILFFLLMFHVCLFNAVLSVPCSLMLTCMERADLLALLCVIFSCVLTLSHMVS